MAKYQHRIFEMYDFREEAVRALRPKTASPVTESIDSKPREFKHLASSRSESVTHVEFKGSQGFADDSYAETERDMPEPVPIQRDAEGYEDPMQPPDSNSDQQLGKFS